MLKVILPETDSGSAARIALRQAAEDGWDEVFFEFATWDLRAAIGLVAGA